MPTPAVYAADAQGFPTQYAQKIENLYPNAQGDNIQITTAANDALVAIALGVRAYSRFDLFHTGYAVGSGTAAGYFRSLSDSVAAAPTISAVNSVAWTLVGSPLQVVESDYTVSTTPPVAPNPYPSSQWSLDGYYPSLYMWSMTGVAAGTWTVNLKTVFNDPTSTSDLSAGAQAAGRPIFDGGVTFLIIRFSGVLTVGASDGSSYGTSTAAKAAPAAFTTTQGSELLLATGLMKSGNVFSAGKVNQGGTDTADAVTTIANGKLLGSEAHYAVEMATPASANAATYLYFSNPLGYEMQVGNLALKHS